MTATAYRVINTAGGPVSRPEGSVTGTMRCSTISFDCNPIGSSCVNGAGATAGSDDAGSCVATFNVTYDELTAARADMECVVAPPSGCIMQAVDCVVRTVLNLGRKLAWVRDWL